MEPTLLDGDWLLVDPDATPAVGEMVVARDPREPRRLVVKRVKSTGDDGDVVVGGDHPAHDDEVVQVASRNVVGRPWFRYWPLGRLGRVR